VGVCFYDRRLDALNFRVDRFCTTSTDGGLTFSANVRQTPASFLPIHGTDGLINAVYMGDYDSPAADFTLTHEGFVSPYQVNGAVANVDVRAVRVLP
jgi:hypothetical protein